MSCCCCCHCEEPKQPPRPEEPQRPPEQEPQFCKLYTVSFTTLNVTKSDDGFASGELEVEFTFVVNGQTQVRTFFNPALQVGTHTLNVNFTVQVPTPQSVISVQVIPVEEDGQQFASFTHQYGQPENWGVGTHSGGGTNNLAYTVDYFIACAEPRLLVVPRSSLVAYATERAKKRKLADLSGTQLLTWALNKLVHNHWEVIDVKGDEVVLKGFGDFADRVLKDFAK